MKFSIIIPVHNEEESIGFVLDEVEKMHPTAEILVVNDGSTDRTQTIVSERKNVTLLSFAERKGQSHATWHGLNQASHELCVLMDGDGECDPQDIHKLLEASLQADFVCGYRINRKRSIVNRAASKIANRVRSIFTRDSARDTGAMKLIRKSHLPHLHLFEGMHRFIPSFLESAGLTLIEVPIQARKRFAGKTKYTIHTRTLHGLVDIVRVKGLLK